MSIVEELIGPDLIVNNASILAFNPGVSYALGWHRDVIQIPEEEIEDRLFSADRFHNSVQINLPLVQEDALEIVPASHNRANNEAENEVFAGTKHYAPLDAEMPGVDGWEAAETISKDDATSSIPIYMCTGHDLSGEEEDLKRVGAKGYITKPYQSENMLGKVKEALG